MNMRPIPTIVSAFMAALVLATPPAKGDVLVNTFGPNDTHDNSAGTGVFVNSRVAVAITSDNNFILNRIEAPLRSSRIPATPTPVTLSIVSNANGLPGNTVLWTNTQTVSTAATYAFTAPALELTAGETYWLVTSTASEPIGWNLNPGFPRVIVARSSGTTWTFSSTSQPAYRISSVPIACCNPGTGHCAVVEVASCIAMQLQDLGTTTCAPDACRACRADFDQNGATNVDDLFLFLNEWFVGCP